MTTTAARPLLKILGLGFGLAIALGTTLGVGILRLPGTVAAALGDPTLIMVAWLLGSLYALMGAVAIAELAVMIPKAGGFRVYARSAFGEGVGFTVGWLDWLVTVTPIAYLAVTAVTYLGSLWQPVLVYPRASAILIIVLFTGIHWIGLRIASSITTIISVAIGVALMIVVTGCFLSTPVSTAAPLAASAALPMTSIAMIIAMVPALRAILTAYDGWYSPMYMAEENTDPTRTLPRAIIGGTLLIVALYLLINAALLRILLCYVSAFLAVFVLRRRLPTLHRPYKAFGYPFSTAIVLIGSILFVIAAVAEDPRSGCIAAIFLACCAPAYAWAARRRRGRVIVAPVLQ